MAGVIVYMGKTTRNRRQPFLKKFFFTEDMFIDVREKRREKEREKKISIGCLLYVHYGIEPTT